MFAHRFTVGLDSDGQPVQRHLSEMTAADVLAALAWHAENRERLEAEARPVFGLAKALHADTSNDLKTVVQTMNASRGGLSVIRKMMEAQTREIDLRQRIVAAMLAPWERHSELTLTEAVLRFWPG
jgi:hypothetical protein